MYEYPVIDGVPCSQETARDIIADLDSFSPDIRKRGSEKLAELKRQAALHGREVCVVEMQKVAKSAWQPETTVSVSNAFMGFYALVLAMFIVGVTFGGAYAPFVILAVFGLVVGYLAIYGVAVWLHVRRKDREKKVHDFRREQES